MDFEQAVVQYASPALCGIKPGCLFSLPRGAVATEARRVRGTRSQLAACNKRMEAVLGKNGIVLFFVYDAQLLARTLQEPGAALYLAQKGYPVAQGMAAVLAHLLARLSQGNPFPHEVGLFLGYPLEDVVAFEADAGRNAKCTASWQVYGNVEEAERKHRLYKSCAAECMAMQREGLDICAICKRYAGMSANAGL